MGILQRTIKSVLAPWNSKICLPFPFAGLDKLHLSGQEASFVRPLSFFVEGNKG